MNRFAAYRLEGTLPGKQAVTVQVTEQRLLVFSSLGIDIPWTYAEVRQTQGARASEPVRLERGSAPATEVLVFDDPGILTALQTIAPEWRRKFHDPSAHQSRRKRRWLVGLGVVSGIAALYGIGLPLLAHGLSHAIPVSWEERLGEAVQEKMAPSSDRCTDPALLAFVDALVLRLATASEDHRYTFRAVVSDTDVVNAFAAPGGYLVIERGLLQRMRHPEELAGVLAHELQHVLQRHTTQALVRELSSRLLLSLLVGDSAALGQAVGAVSRISQLSYSRTDESSADKEGLALLARAGMAPSHMAAALERLKATDEERLEAPDLSFLSTHPDLDERILALKTQALEVRPVVEAIPLAVPWESLRDLCRASAAERP
jgi:beta-barrel assembly-enhancing protease